MGAFAVTRGVCQENHRDLKQSPPALGFERKGCLGSHGGLWSRGAPGVGWELSAWQSGRRGFQAEESGQVKVRTCQAVW